MSSIKTRFAGLELSSPVIVGSSSQTASVSKLVEFEKAGAGAVVLKSLFEESITMEIAANDTDIHPEAYDYLAGYIGEKVLSDYLGLIREAKKSLSIPVIASIACHTDGKWEEFAKRIEEAGADALELNIMSLCTARNYTAGSFEKMNADIIAHVSRIINIPVIAKIGSNLTNPVELCDRFLSLGAKGVVLFNRFYPTDIDIDKIQAIEDMKRDMQVLLAKSRCKQISRDEVHALIDEIYESYEADGEKCDYDDIDSL